MKISPKSIVPLFIAAVSVTGMIGCNSPYTPKPRGYYSIKFPEHRYQVFDRPGYPYTFEYPVYAKISQDSTFFEEQPENPYWKNAGVTIEDPDGWRIVLQNSYFGKKQD